MSLYKDTSRRTFINLDVTGYNAYRMSCARPTIPKILSTARKSQRAYGATARPGEKFISSPSDCQVLIGVDDFYKKHETELSEDTVAAFIAFRGTTNGADWGTNSRLRMIPSSLGDGARVHRGFAESWESVKDQVFEELVGLAPERITLTGHSLGGACAVIASTDIIAGFPGVPVDLITFGGPRCGNPAYSKAIAKNVSSCTRVVHDNDIVPSMPTVALGYAHSATEWLHILEGDTKTNVELVWKQPEDGWWFEMRTMFARLFTFDRISDHDIERYIDGCGGGPKAE